MSNNINWSSILSSALRSKLCYEDNESVQSIWSSKSFDNIKLCDTYEEFEKQIILEEFDKLKEPPIYIVGSPESNIKSVAYLWFINDTAYLSFQGTHNARDVLLDANATTHDLNDTPQVRVHRGFYKYFMSLQPQISDELNKHTTVTTKLHIQGHSLASAVSQIAAVVFKSKFPEKTITCHTIGCPRTGNFRFVEEFSKSVSEHYRIANEKDPVTMVPMRRIWNHTFDNEITLMEDGSIKTNTEDTPWYLRLFYSLFNIEFLHPIDEHNTSLYTQRLNAQITKNPLVG
jgi:predicted lipase